MENKTRHLLTVLIMLCSLSSFGMEYGLRFKSHSFPANERTSLTLGTSPYKLDGEIAFGFEMGFYDPTRFGLICTATGNDGTTVSLVSSAVDGGYQPGIVINNHLHLIPVSFDATPSQPQHPIIILRRSDNKVIFVYNKERFTFPVDLSKTTSVDINFGKLQTQATVAPVEIQDIRIYQEAQNTHKWELRQHQGDSTADELKGVIAISNSPHWLIDEHIAWSKIYSLKTDEKIQTAFNPEKELFYIVSPKRITEYNPISDSSLHIEVAKDGRAMKYSNYLVYDSITDNLLSYSLDPKRISSFDFNTKQWINAVDTDIEPHFANHGYASDGTNSYLFGGYGFYMYHNNLVKLNMRTGEMEDITLHPLPDPRTSSSLCVANGKLYLFGGMGNSVGKQEIPSKHYFDLWEYDLDTMKGQKVWEMDSVSYDFLPSSSMYYVDRDSCFYFASTLFGGCMMSISPYKEGYEIVSNPIHSKMDFRDCVFNLYRSADAKDYYLVIDKRLNDFSHDYAIYQIAYPFSDALLFDTYLSSVKKEPSTGYWSWIIGVLLAIVAISCGYFVMSRRRNKQSYATPKIPTAPSTESPVINVSDPILPNNSPEAIAQQKEESDTIPTHIPSVDAVNPIEKTNVTVKEEPVNELQETSRTAYFNRSKSAISFLGTFEVKDINGVDITPKFTSRIRDLLIMLIVYSEKDEKGISYETLDEAIWFDKDEKSAKNNRNVYMRKLRVLLEEIGNMEIAYDKGYYRINACDVTIDYHEIMTRLHKTSNPDELSNRDLDEMIELLLNGPLLPSVTYEWLDDFKSNYTALSIQFLSHILERMSDSRDKELVYKIADTISHHDQLSEEAMAIKCRILTQQRMKGVAKNVYDAFCREYEKSYGEEYEVPFSKILQSDADE